MKILLNKESGLMLDSLDNNTGHALGIFASSGSGKFYTAMYVAERILGKSVNDNSPELHIVRPTEKSTITIEQARGVIGFLKLKGNIRSSLGRIVIIDNAHLMTSEAQNALLKTLEEAPTDALIIITASDTNNLLPTIISRLQILNLRPVRKSDALDFFGDAAKTTDFERAWKISGGRVGLMAALIEDKEHPLLPTIEEAKLFLAMDQFERLCSIDKLSKLNVRQFIDALQLVSDAAFKQSNKSANSRQLRSWHKIRNAAFQANDDLKRNVHTKLTLSNLILNI